MKEIRIKVEEEFQSMQNPIKNNRIVNDTTFAIRLKNFMDGVRCCDCAGEEEKEYFQMVADKLVKYQVKTATDESEIKYLKNLKLM